MQSVPITTNIKSSNPSQARPTLTLCDKVCQWLATGWWFSPVSYTNKTDRHDITEMLLKVALTTITPPPIENKNKFNSRKNLQC
jgi:hypothetical protein